MTLLTKTKIIKKYWHNLKYIFREHGKLRWSEESEHHILVTDSVSRVDTDQTKAYFSLTLVVELPYYSHTILQGKANQWLCYLHEDRSLYAIVTKISKAFSSEIWTTVWGKLCFLWTEVVSLMGSAYIFRSVL